MFISPHQFLPGVCEQIRPIIKPGAIGITCIKGMFVSKGNCQLPSQFLNESLNIPMAALSGANIAIDVAKEEMSEATIGCLPEHNEMYMVNEKFLRFLYI